jgi:exodeoxyribonuclease V gamma subunit
VLHVHRSDRADGLVEALCSLLSAPPADPFTPEVVSVATRGMERWISQRIGDRLGVCANVEFPFPRRLVGDAVAVASGVDPERDPWLPERAVWPLIEVVDERLGEPWLEALAAHLGDPEDELRRGRRYAAVRHLADLFDRYALHRPDMVRGWVGGDRERWQARLFCCLRERIGIPSPAERLAAACDRLRAEPSVSALPDRLALFNLTRLPAGYRAVLEALAAEREVHLFLLHPSAALWDRVAAAPPPSSPRREDDPTAALPVNRLLASWGQDAREMQLVLAGAGAADHLHAVEDRADTLLGRIQADVRADRFPPPPADPDGRPLLDESDDSVQVHACHGRARQVEVLRDAILHLLQADRSLQPRDVIVMCPDIETFAPLVHATFGAAATAEEDDALPPDVRPPDLRVRLADRSLRQTNPVLGVVAQLLELADQRLTASQVLDFANREPVRRRFGLDDDDLVRIEDWVAESGIRWGLDAEHRRPFGLQALEHGTWRAGLDRVLLGVAMTEDERRLFGGVLPVDDVESGAIDLAGRFAELVERLGAALDALRGPLPVAEWTSLLAETTDLLTDVGARDAWQRVELQRILDDVAGRSTTATELSLREVRSLFADRLAGRPTRANFRTGHLTVCTLMPMRSVPHRVVCLLGLDDNVFPRRAPRDGDDLLLEDPHVGERDPRAEDRQLTLDALMAAREKLIVTYTGNDERTNAVRPPAVPVGELLDVVDRTVRLASGRRARTAVLRRHPLQPFDPRNFDARRPWRFDRVALAGARALEGDRPEPPPFLARPLDVPPSPLVELEDLVRFVQHPVKAFLRLSLGLSLGDFSTELSDSLPVQLEGLDRWGVGQRLLDAVLEGCDPRAATKAEIARGLLPPRVLGKPVIDEVWPTVGAIADAARAELGDMEASSVEARATVGGRVVGGTVPNVRNDVLRTATYSRIAPKHRLAAWARLLVLTVGDPSREWRAVTIGKARDGDGVAVVRIPPLDRSFAEARLLELLDLFDRGMREPLPLACKTSEAYARVGLRAACSEWESGFNRSGEDAEPEHQLAFGGVRSFDDLRAEPPAADERWDPTEPSRFGRYAKRLWQHLLDVEER